MESRDLKAGNSDELIGHRSETQYIRSVGVRDGCLSHAGLQKSESRANVLRQPLSSGCGFA